MPSPDGMSESEGSDSEASFTIVSGRNQYVAFQLRFSSAEPFMILTDNANWLAAEGHCRRARLQMDLGALPHGFHIEPLLVGSVKDEEDVLQLEYLDRKRFSSDIRRRHVVYLRIFIPTDMPAENVDISLRAYVQEACFSAEKLAWTGRVHLQVSELQLASPREWGFHLDLWQHYSSIARIHRTALWSDEHFELITKYLDSLSQLGQKAVTVVATEMPWAGQQCFREQAYPSALFEHAIVSVSYDRERGLELDFDALERLLLIAAERGMDQEIEVFGLLSVWTDNDFGPLISGAPEAWRVRYFDRNSECFAYIESEELMESFIQSFYQFFVRSGLVHRVRVCADEPSDVSRFRRQLEFLGRLAPEFRLKIAINSSEFLDFADGSENPSARKEIRHDPCSWI